MRRLLLIIVAVVSLPQIAAAEETPQRKVHVLQQRPFLRRLRAEVTPLFGYGINQVLYQYLQVGGTFRFHFVEDWSIGGTYMHYFPSATGTADQVENELGVYPEKAYIRWFAGGEVAWVPIYGKFIGFRSFIAHWDVYLTAGAGATMTNQKDPLFTGTFGVGSRIFLTRWLTFTLELKDHIFSQPYKAGDEIVNNLTVQTGFSFFFPNFKYTKRK